MIRIVYIIFEFERTYGGKELALDFVDQAAETHQQAHQALAADHHYSECKQQTAGTAVAADATAASAEGSWRGSAADHPGEA